MNGAVAAGHPLTAAAGARVLAEGGNAVDACVAAAFAGWVTESPLTGPGAGGFMLVRPAGGRPARVADFFVAEPGLGRRRAPGAEMEAVDIGFGGAARRPRSFGSARASCAVPGAPSPGSRPCTEPTAACRGPSCSRPAIELARDGVELNRAQAHLHAILDPILRHGAEGRRLYRGRTGPACSRAMCCACPIWPRRSSRSPTRARRACTAATSHARSSRRSRDGGGALDARRPRRLPRGLAAPGRGALPRPRGDLEPAAVVGRRADRLRPRAARTAPRGAGGERRGDRERSSR